MSAKSVMAVVLGLFPMYSHAATRFVATTGVNSGACTSQASPCRTIPYGASQMVAGDTLIVADGTYSEINPIYDAVPSGNAGPDGIPRTADDVYTTVRAANDFGVLIDGSAWTGYAFGIRLREKQFIQVRGFRVHLSQGNENGAPVSIENSNHIKIIRNGFGYAGVTGNSSTVAVGVDSDYVLVEENFAFGGSRYMFLNYWADHVVFRRNVARNDYWIGTLQAAAFTNYDSVNTVWQNNIAIDSNTGCCPGHSGLYAAFFNENKSDRAPDTSQEFHGNIVLNFKAGYGTHLDWLVTGTRKMSNNIWWDGNGAYWGAQGETEIQGFPSQNLPASWPQVSHITSGENAGVYDPCQRRWHVGNRFGLERGLAERGEELDLRRQRIVWGGGVRQRPSQRILRQWCPVWRRAIGPRRGRHHQPQHSLLGRQSWRKPSLSATRTRAGLVAGLSRRQRWPGRRARALENRPGRHPLRRTWLERGA
jgi:hypothetical protein